MYEILEVQACNTRTQQRQPITRETVSISIDCMPRALQGIHEVGYHRSAQTVSGDEDLLNTIGCIVKVGFERLNERCELGVVARETCSIISKVGDLISAADRNGEGQYSIYIPRKSLSGIMICFDKAFSA